MGEFPLAVKENPPIYKAPLFLLYITGPHKSDLSE